MEKQTQIDAVQESFCERWIRTGHSIKPLSPEESDVTQLHAAQSNREYENANMQMNRIKTYNQRIEWLIKLECFIVTKHK